MNATALILLVQLAAPAQETPPVLAFPEPGLDDVAAFEGYQTRFYWGPAGNAVQIYLDASSGRVVHVWADADNESLGFSVRDTLGRPVSLDWGADGATPDSAGGLRTLTYRLRSAAPALEIGAFLMGSMRFERDFQYAETHLQPFDGESYVTTELEALGQTLERLDPPERREHVALLGAAEIEELRSRLAPRLTLDTADSAWLLRAEQPALDGRTRLEVQLRGDTRTTAAELGTGTLHVRSLNDGPVTLDVSIATNAATLTPLRRDDIFNADFFAFYSRLRAAHDSVLAADPSASTHPAVLRYRRLERQVRGVELLAYHEKLMAGLPNFATYFGRDMLMAALLMEPVWADRMLEHVIASALAKVRPDGQVSHEEAVGGQAIRENAAEYVQLVSSWSRARDAGQAARADSMMSRARAVLADLRSVRENHMMRDDDFQFTVVADRYLSEPRVPTARKRAYLLEPAAPGAEESRLARLLWNLDYVARSAQPYAQHPAVENLVGFPARTEGGGWFPGSWRDSGAGYAGGRYAMDVNAIWVPAALDAADRILDALQALGFDSAELAAQAPAALDGPLADWLRDRSAIRRAAATWRDAELHFRVQLPAVEAAARVAAKLAWLPEAEARYWEAQLDGWPAADEADLEFLALALDERGRPIPVMNTDPAMRFMLGTLTATDPPDSTTAAAALRAARMLRLPYPAGLHVDGLGSLVANDAFASREVWESFDRDRYHSPRVVWGREINLILAALAAQLSASTDSTGRPRDETLAELVGELSTTLREVSSAVEASGMGHFELWSYRIDGERLQPVRYGSSTDVQLWNLTSLAVQYLLDELPALPAPH